MGRKLRIKLIAIFAVVLCMNSWFISEHTVEASSKRLSAESTKLWLNQATKLKITLKNRQKGEKLEFSVGKKSSVKIEAGTWKKDTIDFLITPLKENSTILTIKFGEERIKIKLNLSLRKELTAEQIYEKYSGAMVEIKSYDSNNSCYTGSGFFLGNGKILTNYHVIENANRLEITGYHGEKYKVIQIYDYDANLNLAMLGVQTTNSIAFITNTEKVQTGDTIYTIGSPLEYTGSFSEGMISYAKRNMDGKDYIQMTAATSKGSGGGPLINCYGEVIGINTMTIVSAQNINFAIQISKVRTLDMGKARPIDEFYKENAGKVMDNTIIIPIG